MTIDWTAWVLPFFGLACGWMARAAYDAIKLSNAQELANEQEHTLVGVTDVLGHALKILRDHGLLHKLEERGVEKVGDQDD